MSSREEPASEEERAAIAVLAGYERRLARARELYVELVGRGDRIHSEIQAVQAAMGRSSPCFDAGAWAAWP